MAFNLGNFGGQLNLRDQDAANRVAASDPQNAAVRQAAQQNTLGALGTNAVNTNPYAQKQGANGWNQTQKYMGALNTAGDKEKNGLQKVLGIVGMFV